MKKILFVMGAAGFFVFFPHGAAACPSCYGAASGPQVDGVNMAVMSMLGITGLVLSSAGAFFIMLWKRSKILNDHSTGESYLNDKGDIEWKKS